MQALRALPQAEADTPAAVVDMKAADTSSLVLRIGEPRNDAAGCAKSGGANQLRRFALVSGFVLQAPGRNSLSR